MSAKTTQNMAIVRRWYAEVWNQGDLSVADEILAQPESVKRYISTFRAAFPDIQHTVKEMITEGEKVVVRWTAQGTHTGQWHSIAPTNKQVTYDGVTIARIAGDKIVEHRTIWDTLILLEQLGVVPIIRKDDGSRL